MAAVFRADLCQERDNLMTHRPTAIPATGQPGRLPPVRVKLLRGRRFSSRSHCVLLSYPLIVSLRCITRQERFVLSRKLAQNGEESTGRRPVVS